jgi:thiol peroxidase
MSERKGAITFKGNPMTLVGEGRKVGDKAPDATLVANDLSEKKLSDFTGKVVILSVVPSLDTGICDKQTRRFNEEAGKLGQAVVLTVSRDLPFAQKRWCGAAGVEKVQTLSDYRDRTFGTAYGLHIKELGLLARSVMVIDKGGTIRYQELVPEIAQEPNYDAALAAAKQLL